MDSTFMNRVAQGVAESGVRVIRFEFPYMQRRRESGKRGAPDTAPALMQHFREVIDHHGAGRRLVIGGKSMGGRIASMVAVVAGVAPTRGVAARRRARRRSPRVRRRARR